MCTHTCRVPSDGQKDVKHNERLLKNSTKWILVVCLLEFPLVSFVHLHLVFESGAWREASSSA